MINNDQVLGKPLQTYTNTKTNIQAIANPTEGMMAFASNTNELMIYDGAAWNATDVTAIVTGSGTLNRFALWGPGHIIGTSTFAKSGAGVITMSAGDAVTVSIATSGDSGHPGIMVNDGTHIMAIYAATGVTSVVTFYTTGTGALGAGTITATSTNDATIENHTHAITSSSSPGVAASILATNSSGSLTISAGGAATVGFQAGLTANSAVTHGADITNIANGATTIAIGAYARVSTTAAAFTLGNAIALYADNPSKGAGSTITTAYGLMVNDITAGASNYAIQTGAGLINIQDTTDSTGSGNGAIIVGGGIGLAKALNVGTVAGIGMASSATIGLSITNGTQALEAIVSDGATNTAASVVIFKHLTSGTPTTSFGINAFFQAHSANNTIRNQAVIQTAWSTATDASRTSRMLFYLYDFNAARQILALDANGSNAIVTIPDTLDATSYTAAALVISGGVGIAKNLAVHGRSHFGSNATIVSTYNSYFYDSNSNSGSSIFGIVNIINTSNTTTSATGLYSRVDTSNIAFTLGAAYDLYLANPSKGAASTITSAVGLYIENITSGGTNYAIWTAGGQIRFDNINVANGAVASVLTANSGPTGANTAVQGWLKFNVGGTVRYVPFW